MKTPYLLAIVAVVLIGLFFILSDSPEQNDGSQNTPATTENTENVESTNNTESTENGENTESTEYSNTQSQDEESGDISNDIEISGEASIETELDAESTDRVFTLDTFNYGYSEEEIRVQQGDTVTINLTNSGGFHDWVIDEFGTATEKINAGDTTSVTFVADEIGTFEYYCSVGNHRQLGMVGNLVVE
jgi:plastocyanin